MTVRVEAESPLVQNPSQEQKLTEEEIAARLQLKADLHLNMPIEEMTEERLKWIKNGPILGVMDIYINNEL